MMKFVKLMTDNALKNLHVTLPVGSVVALMLCVAWLTASAKDYETRLTTVESYSEKIAQIENNTHDIKELKDSVKDIKDSVDGLDQKFEEKFDGFQEDFKHLVVDLWKQK